MLTVATTRSTAKTLKWATLLPSGAMKEGTGVHGQHNSYHVVLFAMHNEISITFRDSIRIRALLEKTGVTHISTMNLNMGAKCVGHNCVLFKQPLYQVLQQGCPRLVLWDYNFAFDFYVLENYGANLFSAQVPGYFTSGAEMVVIPNWGKQTLPMFHGTSTNTNTNSQHEQSFQCGMKAAGPTMNIKHILLSKKEAETHHPLVVATIAAADKLLSSSDCNARTATWETNQAWIGTAVAFIVLYNVQYIQDPMEYLKSFCNKV